ncbi:MAG: hypothetical protein OXG11_02725, partial [Chloroflexi bacterium]|nr:hypothetical protein [Chloroflexota bacterium]
MLGGIGMDIYELIAWVKFNEGPIKVIGNFVLVVTAAIVAHLLVPWVKKWIKKYQKKQKVKRKAAKALVVQIESDQPKEVRRRALITLWAMVLKEWWFIPVTIGLMVVMFALVIELEREAQAAKLIIAESHLDTVDSARKLLWSRTVRNIEKPEPLREVHTKDEHLQFVQMAEV